jgi:hypothetical protein
MCTPESPEPRRALRGSRNLIDPPEKTGTLRVRFVLAAEYES